MDSNATVATAALRASGLRSSWCGCLLFLALSWAIPGVAQTPLSTADPALRELGRQVQDASRGEAERLELIAVLGNWGTAQVREPLLAVLNDPLPSIRRAAASALGWEGNREAAVALRERVEAPGEVPEVRAAALDALGKIGDNSVRAAVLASTRDPDARVRGTALGALALGRLSSPTDRLPLLRQLAGDQALDRWLRCEAIRQLGEARDPAAPPLLMRLLETEPPVAMPIPRDTATQQEVMRLRYQQARDVRAWAAAILGTMEAKEALPLLLSSAEDPGDFFLRITSMTALVAWKAAEAGPVFVRRLEDPYPAIRSLAVLGLVQVGDRSAADAVRARLSDAMAEVRVQAVGALVDLGHPDARAELEGLRKREIDARVQRAIEEALARLPS